MKYITAWVVIVACILIETVGLFLLEVKPTLPAWRIIFGTTSIFAAGMLYSYYFIKPKSKKHDITDPSLPI